MFNYISYILMLFFGNLTGKYAIFFKYRFNKIISTCIIIIYNDKIIIIILFIALYVSSPFYIILLIIILTVQILIKNVSGFANTTNYK